MVRLGKAALYVTLALALLNPASAETVLLFDDFNSENGGNGAFEYSSFLNWNVTGGNIALIGTGFFDFYPR